MPEAIINFNVGPLKVEAIAKDLSVPKNRRVIITLDRHVENPPTWEDIYQVLVTHPELPAWAKDCTFLATYTDWTKSESDRVIMLKPR